MLALDKECGGGVMLYEVEGWLIRSTSSSLILSLHTISALCVAAI